MTLADAGEIFAYWERDPPVHLIMQTIARLLGWAPQSVSPRIEEIVASAPPGLALVRGDMPDMPTPVLDLEVLRVRNQELAVQRRSQKRSV
jgi:hypothetical protein